jgi:hypothetical protein
LFFFHPGSTAFAFFAGEELSDEPIELLAIA